MLFLHQVGQDDLLRLLVQDLDGLQPQLGPGNPTARERCEVLFPSVVLYDFPLTRCPPEQVAPAVGKGRSFLICFRTSRLWCRLEWGCLHRGLESKCRIPLLYTFKLPSFRYLHLLINSSHYSRSLTLVTHLLYGVLDSFLYVFHND